MIAVDVEGSAVTITMTGIVSDADWDAAVAALEDRLGRQASVHLAAGKGQGLRLLMDWQALQGWEQGARSTCTWFCMGNQDLVDRLAIIGDDRWRDEGTRMADIYKRAQVNFYSPAERSEALRWLGQAHA